MPVSQEIPKERQNFIIFSSLVQATGSTNFSGKPTSFHVSGLTLFLRVRIDFLLWKQQKGRRPRRVIWMILYKSRGKRSCYFGGLGSAGQTEDPSLEDQAQSMPRSVQPELPASILAFETKNHVNFSNI